ncbi:MAG: ATP-binding protein [Bacteroidia bacterium]
MLKKIAIVGPESTGKTSLARQLANWLDTAWVPEYARDYLGKLAKPYDEADLLKIAEGQLALEKHMEPKARTWLLCDTNLAVILIWSMDKFGRISPELEALFRPEAYALHLLMKPDLPWQPDPLREDPHRLEELFEVYRNFLDLRNIPYRIISGSGDVRLNLAKAAIRDAIQA